jgi:cyclohexa-1,5-dienecarbonyl-CoA hydratase
MAYELIQTTCREGLGTITLNRPPLNILNMAMMAEICDVLEAWRDKRDLKVVLFAGAGKCFSAGVDVEEHIGDLAPRMIELFHGMFRSMDRLGAVTIASVHGSCLGGGCELAVFCDLTIASRDATFGQPEIMVGVFPPIAAHIFPRIIGPKAAMELVLSGRTVSAEEAVALGLVNRVVDRATLKKETREFVRPYLDLSAEVLRQSKRALKVGLNDDLEPSLRIIEDIYLTKLMKTHDAHEGLAAFVAKRKPRWKNE